VPPRSTRPGRWNRCERDSCELGVEGQRGHRESSSLGDEHHGRSGERRGDAARSGRIHRIAFLYMAQRPTLDIEMVHEHTVGAEVCGEGESGWRDRKDAVACVLYPCAVPTRGGRGVRHSLDRSSATCPGVVGDEQGAPAPVHAHVAGRAAPDGCSVQAGERAGAALDREGYSAPFSSSFTRRAPAVRGGY